MKEFIQLLRDWEWGLFFLAFILGNYPLDASRRPGEWQAV